jgi:hypothetical protein
MEADCQADFTALQFGRASRPQRQDGLDAPADLAAVERTVAERSGESLAEAVSAAAPEEAAGLSPRGRLSEATAAATAVQAQATRRIIDRQLTADNPDVQAAIAFAAPYLARNPRELKRFVNLFRFLVMIDSERGLRGLPRLADLSAVAKVAVLHVRWPDLLLTLGQVADGEATVCERLEQCQETADPDTPPPGPGPALAELSVPDAVQDRLTAPDLVKFLAAAPRLGATVRHYL